MRTTIIELSALTLFRFYLYAPIMFTEKQKGKIRKLATKGVMPQEAAVAVGISTEAYMSFQHDDTHPFNVLYWDARTDYVERLRTTVLSIVEGDGDALVRVKLLEYLLAEQKKTMEERRIGTSFTDIKKLMTFIKGQGGSHQAVLDKHMKPLRQLAESAKETNNGES